MRKLSFSRSILLSTEQQAYTMCGLHFLRSEYFSKMTLMRLGNLEAEINEKLEYVLYELICKAITCLITIEEGSIANFIAQQQGTAVIIKSSQSHLKLNK